MNKRFFIFGIIGILIVFGVIWGVVASRNKKAVPAPAPSVILHKDVGLTDSQKQVFLDRIKSFQDELGKLSAEKTVDRFELLKSIGNQYYSIGEFGQAKANYGQAAELTPGDAGIWYSLTTAEVQMTDYASALNHITKALALERNNAEYWRVKLDILHIHLRRSDEEVESEIGKALAATQNHPDILSYYATFLAAKGDTKRAIEQWKKAMEVNPEGKAVYEQEIKQLESKLH